MNHRRRPTRQLRPALESVESRELMSGVVAALGPATHARPPLPVLTGNPTNTTVPPFIPSPGSPTLHEVAREHFFATFSGPVVAGPGRFSSEAKTFYYRGVGGSNQFLHGDYQMAIIRPADPTQPAVGGVYMQDRNNNSGAQLGLDLAVTQLDRFGRPTAGTFVNDPNIYSGIYYNDTAEGSFKIRYFGNQAAVVFNGLMYTSGLTGVFRNSGLY